jgi:ABC-type Fe3+-citrate transport system substrate-binding protein
MKKLLLITVLLAAVATKSEAQVKNAIEIKNIGKEFSKNENNEFKITAHEEVDVNLKFELKKENSFNVLITDERNNIVFSQEYSTEGENKITFTMDQDEQYIVKLSNPKLLTAVIVSTTEN